MTTRQARKRPSRRATVYDAVAGKVGNRGRLRSAEELISKPLAPEEALYETRYTPADAPLRYEEDDEYFAVDPSFPFVDAPAGAYGRDEQSRGEEHGRFPRKRRKVMREASRGAETEQPQETEVDALFPDSDLLKAIHRYAAEYYARTLPPAEQRLSNQSLDETALLALGTLLEQAVVRCLGENGELELVEKRSAGDDKGSEGWEDEAEAENGGWTWKQERLPVTAAIDRERCVVTSWRGFEHFLRYPDGWKDEARAAQPEKARRRRKRRERARAGVLVQEEGEEEQVQLEVEAEDGEDELLEEVLDGETEVRRKQERRRRRREARGSTKSRTHSRSRSVLEMDGEIPGMNVLLP